MDKYRNRVFTLLKNVPKGYVVTYGQLAKHLKIPSPRIVGRILHENKNPFNIPCHRVVFANGSLSPSYAFGGAKKQSQKLYNEGVTFIDDKVNLTKHRFVFRSTSKEIV